MNTLSSIDESDLSLFKFDFSKQAAQGKKLGIAKFRLGGSPFKITIPGTVVTNGISVAEFGSGSGKKTVYSLGITPNNEDDLNALTAIAESLRKYVSDDVKDEYEIIDSVKNDRFYLKLPVSDDKKAFKFPSNIPLNPKKAHDSGIEADQELSATVELGAYFNFEDKKAGLMLTPTNVQFITSEA
jgi:hypothetical protein